MTSQTKTTGTIFESPAGHPLCLQIALVCLRMRQEYVGIDVLEPLNFCDLLRFSRRTRKQGSCDGLRKLILCLSPAPLIFQADSLAH